MEPVGIESPADHPADCGPGPAAAGAEPAGRSRVEPGPSEVAAPLLVFDGGCPFCRSFAELSERQGGISGLEIRDGRAETALRRDLNQRGFRLRDGAVVITGGRTLHGAEAISWLCRRMQPRDGRLLGLTALLGDDSRSRRLYPLLLLARRVALGLRGLPVDPDQPANP